ncbi:MAG: hypothetical protein L0I49_03060 [Lactococcus raffinolactis]|nr:hypothetical protein [Lactococcus lactis]MDN6092650.1 hypothetical protein [Lactococcus raffinolactis]MDN6197693.1 hypothetical protein [Lactococcus raffinolactis]
MKKKSDVLTVKLEKLSQDLAVAEKQKKVYVDKISKIKQQIETTNTSIINELIIENNLTINDLKELLSTDSKPINHQEEGN